ncbi:DUF4198 domain-containing protein [Hylemonella gracilis]|uniref:Putative signal peptide protein n=1 Tax=Hylemonella gracilis ATCC 19624 TaxID=887062 RepID=F3KSL8_9BURK|nr:DUF4198 domain-containing protein [Hylemonella gracilis]EGI77087.1 putative signal peptide protein [Hylemonella gracilis ATCC 19624]
MKKHLSRLASTVALAVSAAALWLPTAAQAHRSWLLPSGTVFAGQDPWVTVDAAVSNDIFYFEHFPGNLENLVVIGPDGKPVEAQNQAKGRYRSVFDVKLEQAGTYRIALVNDSLNASYKVGNETKRVRGTAESLRKDIPKDAQDVRVTRSQTRIETFVTRGKPSGEALKPTGRGIELVAVTHPNDLVAGETATFRFLDDGKPAAGYGVTVILAGKRYQDKLTELNLDTDKNGEIKVKWPQAGMYWLEVEPARPAAPQGGPQAGGPGMQPGPNGQGGPGMQGGPGPGPGGTLDKPARRVGYSLTLEVLPQ